MIPTTAALRWLAEKKAFIPKFHLVDNDCLALMKKTAGKDGNVLLSSQNSYYVAEVCMNFILASTNHFEQESLASICN